jgi:hypothetical protein
MQLKRIQAALAAYKTYLETPENDARIYLWESQQIFQTQWNLEAFDLAAMYNRSLDSRHSRRMWNRENYEPKRIMGVFFLEQADFVKQMFQDLFDEKKTLEGRASRFVFYCDQLLDDHREKHRKSKIDGHFHDDGYQIVSLYLAFRYPAVYNLYDLRSFQQILEKFGAPEIPKTHDLERYAKVCKTLYNMIQKEEEILTLHQQRLNPQYHYMDESMLLVYDFMQYILVDHRGALSVP